MTITMIAVMSVDGKITHWEDVQDVSAWASVEDQGFFVSMIQKHKTLVMGRNSYEAVKHRLRLDEDRLRIVLTHAPEKYAIDAVDGKLEFSSESPTELISRLKETGVNDVLLLGGSAIYTSFLNAGLVTDLYLTIEPRIFGKGKMVVGGERLDINLRLRSVKQLNNPGTILLHYNAN